MGRRVADGSPSTTHAPLAPRVHPFQYLKFGSMPLRELSRLHTSTNSKRHLGHPKEGTRQTSSAQPGYRQVKFNITQ